MIKLIASDMDGTLLDSNKNINPEFNKILNTLKEKGIIFAAISGRDLASLKYEFKDVKEDIVFASNNGNFIVYKGKVLFENYIEKEELNCILPTIRKNAKHFTIYCTKDGVYAESLFPFIAGLKFGLKVKVVKDITKINSKVIKISTFGKQKMIDRSLNALNHFKDRFMITPSGSTCFDICKVGGHKGQGIKILQDLYNVKFEETMVFGDHMNDLEMMDYAYFSHAMENAEKEVKSRARFIAKTNDENGVIEAIKKHVIENYDNSYSYN